MYGNLGFGLLTHAAGLKHSLLEDPTGIVWPGLLADAASPAWLADQTGIVWLDC